MDNSLQALLPLKESEVFFVTGVPKSGTTWMMNLLNSVEEIYCSGEGRFFSSGLRDVPSLFDSLSGGLGNWYEFIALRKKNWLGLDDKIRTMNRQNYLSHNVLSKSFDNDIKKISRLIVLYFLGKAKITHPGCSLFGDKTPVTRAEQLDNIICTFPESKVIFLHRHVKDFIVSILFHHWRATLDNRPDKQIEYLSMDDFFQVEDFIQSPDKNHAQFTSEQTAIKLAAMWNEVKRKAVTMQEHSPETFLMVSYDDMMQQPALTAQQVFSFLTIEVQRAQLDDIIRKNSIESIRNSNNSFLKNHIRSGKPEDWKNYLSDHLSRCIDDYLE